MLTFYLPQCILQVKKKKKMYAQFLYIYLFIFLKKKGMAANPIVIAKANILLPHLNFDFMTWLQGSVVPCMVCAISLPLLLRWTLSIDKIDNGKRTGSNAVKHAQIELDKMGPVSKKEWVKGIRVITMTNECVYISNFV